MKSEFSARGTALLWAAMAALNSVSTQAQPTDPGVRTEPADNATPAALTGLAPDEREYFQDGAAPICDRRSRQRRRTRSGQWAR
jgi:hypothetical protein